MPRHIPAAIRREVYERDGGRCTFLSEDGRRCNERGFLEFEHLDGFARTQVHSTARITLRCRGHNALSAERMYGADFMQTKVHSTRPRTGGRQAGDSLPLLHGPWTEERRG